MNNTNNAWKEIADVFACDSVQIMKAMNRYLRLFGENGKRREH
jgi:hypothetical protein